MTTTYALFLAHGTRVEIEWDKHSGWGYVTSFGDNGFRKRHGPFLNEKDAIRSAVLWIKRNVDGGKDWAEWRRYDMGLWHDAAARDRWLARRPTPNVEAYRQIIADLLDWKAAHGIEDAKCWKTAQEAMQ